MCVVRRGTPSTAPPSRAHSYTQEPMRPRLPRGLSTSARINLNHYWSVLEDLVTCSCPVTSPEVNNVINENRANEMRELSAVPVSPQGQDESLRTRVLSAVPVSPQGEDGSLRTRVLSAVPVSPQGQDGSLRTRVLSAVPVSPQGQDESLRTRVLSAVPVSPQGQDESLRTRVLSAVPVSSQGQDESLRTRVLSAVPASPQGQDGSLRTRVLGSTRRNFWRVLVHSSPSKRKMSSISIKQIVKKLTK